MRTEIRSQIGYSRLEDTMLSTLLLLTVQSTRAVPLALPPKLRSLTFTVSSPGLQVGRAQAIRWEAKTPMKIDEVLAQLNDWTPHPERSTTRVRWVGKVRQTMSFGRGLDWNILNVSILEEPPQDGSIPPDWPAEYRRGLVRLLPDIFGALKGQVPIRIESNYTPIGHSATATYRLLGAVEENERRFAKEVSGWKRVMGRDAVRFIGAEPTFFRSTRLITSLKLENSEKGTLAGVTWMLPPCDLAGSTNPNSPGPKFAGKPVTSIPKAILGDVQGSLGWIAENGAREIVWKRELTKPLSDIAKFGRARKVPVKEAEQVTFEIRTPPGIARVTATDGRLRPLVVPPKGWIPTADFGGYWEEAVRDRGRYITVTVTERRSSASASWPDVAKVVWPVPGVTEFPLPEMKQAPTLIRFSPGGLVATWRLRFTPERAKELEGFRYQRALGSRLLGVGLGSDGKGTNLIRATYGLGSGPASRTFSPFGFPGSEE